MDKNALKRKEISQSFFFVVLSMMFKNELIAIITKKANKIIMKTSIVTSPFNSWTGLLFSHFLSHNENKDK